MKSNFSVFSANGILFLIVLLALASCTLPGSEGQVGIALKPPASEKAQVIFTAKLPALLEEGETLELIIIDEVTGIPFNQTRVPMTNSDSMVYVAFYSAPVGTVISYRYEKIQNGSRFIEHNALREPVEKRVFVVEQPDQVYDEVAGFDEKLDLPEESPGYVTGKVVHADTGNPISDILIYCEGLQTTTDGNGNFTLYPLYPAAAGSLDIFAYSTNGAYLPFRQQANIEYGLSTPVEILMAPSVWKKVTFTVTVPEDTVQGAPIRLAGNLTQLGNTFQDLGGGITGDVHNMPILIRNEYDRYTVSINLPAGIDIRYKYTLGDGFWNAEHGIDQNFTIHQIIIPPDADELYIHDTVYSWMSSQTEAIWFQVTTPENTPPDENLGIQFQLADWMPPLPMFKIEDGRWAFPILSPHNFSGAITYRYCRNGPCTGPYQPGVETLAIKRETTTQFTEIQLITDQITEWISLDSHARRIETDALPQTREGNFIAGINLSPYYSLTSQPFMDTSIKSIAEYSNLIVFSPGWVAQDPSSPVLFSPDKTQTPSWHETIENLELTNDLDMRAGVFPQITYEGGAQAWWQAANTADETWWQQWINQYQRYIYQFADLAQSTESDVFVIGGDWVFYAMPVGSNFSIYNQPGNIEQIWRDTISGIREHFSGAIAVQIPINQLSDFPASLLGTVDEIFIQWDTPLDHSENALPFNTQIGEALDNEVKPISNRYNQPVVIVLTYPSAQGFNNGCIPSRVEPDTCLDATPLLFGPPQGIQAVTDLDIQSDFYLAALQAVNTRPWIQGIISQGYYPAIEMHDGSASIHGKPAEALVSIWYAQFLGK